MKSQWSRNKLASHDRRAHHREWIAGDRVLARNMRPGPAWIPGTIVEVLGPVTYVVETETGQRWKRHADQLKDWLPRDSPSTLDVDSEGIDSNSGNPEIVIRKSMNRKNRLSIVVTPNRRTLTDRLEPRVVVGILILILLLKRPDLLTPAPSLPLTTCLTVDIPLGCEGLHVVTILLT